MTRNRVDDQLEATLKKTFGGATGAETNFTSKLPGLNPKLIAYEYTSEKEIRKRVSEMAQKPSRKFTPEQLASIGVSGNPLLKGALVQPKTLSPEERQKLIETWIEKVVASARKRDRLMTDQQLADWQIGRRLMAGDAVRYVGPDREEVTQAQLIVPRPHGQEGFISHVGDTREGRVLTFHPNDPVAPVRTSYAVDKQFVDLQVREYTAGWLYLERIIREQV